MLLGEQSCGNQHSNLAPVLYRLKRGAHRNFGLTKPNIAADQPVHWDGRFHVALDGFHGN
jgi:hypothetical protein